MKSKLTRVPPKQLALQIFRLGIAMNAFQEAIEGIGLLKTLLDRNAIKPQDRSFHCMVTGIVVSYLRPFTESNGLGSLPADYSRFPKHLAFLKRCHEHMVSARHSILAHYDLHKVSEISATAPIANKNEVPDFDATRIGVDRFQIAGSGPVHIATRTNTISLNPQFLEVLYHLLNFQILRLQANLQELKAPIAVATGTETGYFEFRADGTFYQAPVPSTPD